ncbi:alpha,alpha-trehalose-phosphate synthase (UDP-forming) [Comamonas endophytica]|uniref:Trehalose-6-phosphate synthase n=1 Tax=Comamonas endophytica TaxID=2949090 RepID=A0ABY6GFD1_9BURK|nr:MULTISPECIES: trehalose-6-phosphate synthase [unclassified Acidovorax]MCD2513427.1 trehalose-6-phosphate synthase [Acidovorax sp. D4N7]UYG53791.1 trehalose-6-phosphate synthase [Acidovorax sp. 5MLIR]
MKLIIVSNRVCHDEKPQAGGLAAAVQDTFSSVQGLWIGWSGDVSDSCKRKSGTVGNIEFEVFSLTEKEYRDYYLAYSNEVLWPICHLRPDHLHPDEEAFRTYRQVNEKFAAEVLAHAHEDDVVWVHDYHLLLTAKALRDRGHLGTVGYFHHIPVPPMDLLRMVPQHAELFGGLLSYDVVGLQTGGDLKNLADYFQALKRKHPDMLIFHAGSEMFNVRHHGRTTRFGVYPISIDTARIEGVAPQARAESAVQQLKASLGDSPLVIGVDRLDYSKGLKRKFLAFERYIAQARQSPSEEPPVLLQIASKSRSELSSYQQLCTELESLASRINGSHGTPTYAPIRYVNAVYEHGLLTGFYRLARAALVTPLKDGMNLVAKEYLAAQDPDDPGVLILSEFAGAAHELSEALLVNPFDLDSVAQAIERALQMPRLERVQRHRAMLKRLRSHDIQWWHQRYLSDLFSRQGQALEKTGS